MTKSEELYARHLKMQTDKTFTTGNWESLIVSLQQAKSLPSPIIQQTISNIAEHMASAIYSNILFTQMLNNSSPDSLGNTLTSIGDLLVSLDNMPGEVFGLACLSRNKIKELTITGYATSIAIQLQKELVVFGIDTDDISARTKPEAYLATVIKPVKETYELYQWANSQNPKYYDTVLSVNDIQNVLRNPDIDSATVLSEMLSEEYEMQGFELDNVCER